MNLAKNYNAKLVLLKIKMTDLILKCLKCGEYGFYRQCKCGGECISTKPGKFSPADKYSKYRNKYRYGI